MPCIENKFKVRFGKWLLKEHFYSFPHYNSGRKIADVQSPHITLLDNDMITIYKTCPRLGALRSLLKITWYVTSGWPAY